jgi:hypothetical protein
MLNFDNINFSELKTRISEYATGLSSELISWLVVVMLHASTIPTLIAVMMGITDNMPPVDLTLMIWSALVLLFIKATVKKHTLNILTIGLGFFVQAAILALIFFK